MKQSTKTTPNLNHVKIKSLSLLEKRIRIVELEKQCIEIEEQKKKMKASMGLL